jgi:hypothetical protein
MTLTNALHPTFANWFKRFFIRAWLVIAVLFALSLLLLKNGFSILGTVSGLSFGLGIIFTLSYLFYNIYHIDCPNCHNQLKTIKNTKLSKYEAICERCQISWDIGIGIDNSG